MDLLLQIELMFQLTLAAILSMVIGLNRERGDKSAGMRTHMLAGVGACLFTMVSVNFFASGDPSRVASNVVTGIGFLGAGAIFRRGNQVKALTTAASLWSTAGIGMAVGVGAWLLAIGATILIWVILAVLQLLPFEREHRAAAEAIVGDGE